MNGSKVIFVLEYVSTFLEYNSPLPHKQDQVETDFATVLQVFF